MSGLFQPDDIAYPDSLESIKLLSQRDVSIHIPVDYVPVPGVALSASCFSDHQYESNHTIKCVSNLLAAGFRRFALDVYWDESRSVWGFCPAQISPVTTPGSSVTSRTSTATVAARGTLLNEARQELVASTSQSSSPSSTAAVQASDANTVQLGEYTCSPDLSLSTFLSTLTAFLAFTENNLNATTTYVTLSLYAARRNPTVVASAPSHLPSANLALSSLIDANASDYLYTPSNLALQRQNLNATGSWFSVPQDVLPDSTYFQVDVQNKVSTTPDGWPSESFIEFTRYKRLLVSFAAIGSEMSGYNLSMDSATIFQPGYIYQNRSITLGTNGSIQNGCFFDPSTTSLQAVNNSWAVAYTQNTSTRLDLSQAANLADCGYSVILNQTLNGTLAVDNPAAYREFASKAIWSWDTSEPQEDAGHCAALNSTSGRWQVTSCSSSRYCACDTGQPYAWQISTSALQYDRVDQACPSGSTFGLSRTALENAYLLETWRSARSTLSISDELLFLNLNDLSISSCWVVGQNGTCPYTDQDTSESRTITVPTVAGVIILVLTILTIFMKCSANRRTSRRQRRRREGGWEYEGVPS